MSCEKLNLSESFLNSKFFRKHIATLPDTADIHYICDNLSNHSCHEFCRVVAELSGVDYPEKELDTKDKNGCNKKIKGLLFISIPSMVPD